MSLIHIPPVKLQTSNIFNTLMLLCESVGMSVCACIICVAKIEGMGGSRHIPLFVLFRVLPQLNSLQ